jgi:hypothetical protein
MVMNPNAGDFDPGFYGGASEYYNGAQDYPNFDEQTQYTHRGNDLYNNTDAHEKVYYPQIDEAHHDFTYNDQGGSAHYDVPSGSYYPVEPLLPLFAGEPISALSYDNDNAYEAIFFAFAARPMGKSYNKHNSHKASMLTVHSTTDGSLYSSVAGHPQAAPTVLRAVLDSIYGSSTTKASSRPIHIPAHAFRPYYGTSSTFATPPPPRAMGIHTLLPIYNDNSNYSSPFFIASVSPFGARIHTHGGLLVGDRPMDGLLCGTVHARTTAHVTVGGLDQVTCLNESLQTTASFAATSAVTALATSHVNGTILAGYSDGNVRLLDKLLRPLATIKTNHAGGIVAVAVSGDGTLLATTGYGSKGWQTSGGEVYAFPDPMVYVYDVRYLGRGGIAHPFSGARGGPRHLLFVPDIVPGQVSSRLLVASGQRGGGLQIIEPFQDASNQAANFLLPPLGRDAITAMHLVEDKLALGTCSGVVHQYKLADYSGGKPKMGSVESGMFVPMHAAGNRSGAGTLYSTSSSIAPSRKHLEMPPFQPLKPELSFDAAILQTKDSMERQGPTAKIRSIFSSYILVKYPKVSTIEDPNHLSNCSFGYLASRPIVAPSTLRVSTEFLEKGSPHIDHLPTVATADLELDLFTDHRPEAIQKKRPIAAPLSNTNKFLYTAKLYSLVYEESLNRAKKMGRRSKLERKSNDDELAYNDHIAIPESYRLSLRHAQRAASSFNYADSNESGFVPGFDYSISLPNAFVPPVVMLLYLIPEIKATIMSSTALDDLSVLLSNEKKLLPEVQFLFDRVDSITRNAMIFPGSTRCSSLTRTGAWGPSNLISCLTTLPEAEQLQILDSSPSAVSPQRRPEAFYRFLLHQIDKEFDKCGNGKRLDAVAGMDFVSINEYVSGSDPPSQAVTRAMAVELYYDSVLRHESSTKRQLRFGNVLHQTLSRETRLRAWSQGSKSYEAIVQRKIATTLPKVFSLSCACAGRNLEEGLCLWRNPADNGFFLPEKIEIELDAVNGVIVRELVQDALTGQEEWMEFKDETSLPQSISDIVKNLAGENGVTMKRRYRLDAVLSLVRDELDANGPPEVIELSKTCALGHHVLHSRITNKRKAQILTQQISALTASIENDSHDMTVFSVQRDKEEVRDRISQAEDCLAKLNENPSGDSWVMVNGYVVSDTVVEDARAFHVNFKEPLVVIFRAICNDQNVDDSNEESTKELSFGGLSADVLNTISLSKSTAYGKPLSVMRQSPYLPTRGDLIAFDAEFVLVQEEESTLTETGSKIILREMRHAVARISVVDCRTRKVLLDDHVLPREPVVDYLTRFSGIVERDLRPQDSPQHLISTSSAYLKLRYLMECGCIFVGHGLQQDFWTLNLHVPLNQVSP